jgi:hypothetical protein
VALVDRAKAMITQPALEWPAVAAEPATTGSILQGYVIPLALIGPVCSLVSTFAFLHRSIVFAVALAALTFVLEIVGVFAVAFIADALAPSFGATKDSLASFKWIAYSSTARWVAGVLQLVPIAGSFLIIVASFYSLYVLYLGAVPVMKIAPDKAAGFTIVVIVAYIVVIGILSVCVGALIALLFAGAIVGASAITR